MMVEIAPEISSRLSSWSISTHEPPEKFVSATLENALEDWEDYSEALKICAEIDSGRMETYSMEEVWRELDGMEG